jgi:hypothetical protein
MPAGDAHAVCLPVANSPTLGLANQRPSKRVKHPCSSKPGLIKRLPQSSRFRNRQLRSAERYGWWGATASRRVQFHDSEQGAILGVIDQRFLGSNCDQSGPSRLQCADRDQRHRRCTAKG